VRSSEGDRWSVLGAVVCIFVQPQHAENFGRTVVNWEGTCKRFRREREQKSVLDITECVLEEGVSSGLAVGKESWQLLARRGTA
jgi:hypothetical protein